MIRPGFDLLEGIELVAFDKDGTLIDFGAMWEPWVRGLAHRLGAVTGLAIEADLETAMGLAPETGRATPLAPVAISIMERLREIAVEVAMRGGLDRSVAEARVESVWDAPDPVATAVPLTDLPSLFGALRDSGRRIAVVTADDRAPTLLTLAALGVDSLIDAVRCADDGLPPKPRPEMLLSVCAELGVEPAATAMVGDTPGDLEMGRAAGAGAVIGVLSGVGTPDALAPSADILLDSIADLVPAAADALPSVA